MSQDVDERREQQKRESLRHAVECAQIADEFKGRDIVVLDLTEITPMFDYFVISTAASRRQMRAIVDESNRFMKSKGSYSRGAEGVESDSWFLQDYGDIVVHVFNEESRELYDLERLWGDAQPVDWRAVQAANT